MAVAAALEPTALLRNKVRVPASRRAHASVPSSSLAITPTFREGEVLSYRFEGSITSSYPVVGLVGLPAREPIAGGVALTGDTIAPDAALR